jgi:hypothetical protein
MANVFRRVVVTPRSQAIERYQLAPQDELGAGSATHRLARRVNPFATEREQPRVLEVLDIGGIK